MKPQLYITREMTRS